MSNHTGTARARACESTPENDCELTTVMRIDERDAHPADFDALM